MSYAHRGNSFDTRVDLCSTDNEATAGTDPECSDPLVVDEVLGAKVIDRGLPATTPAAHRDAVTEVVYDAVVNIAAPANDKFIVITEHNPSGLVMDPHYIVERTERALIIQITLNTGRTIEVKKNLYRAIADGLHDSIGSRTEDVFINLVEVPKENWSFGLGEAQYAN